MSNELGLTVRFPSMDDSAKFCQNQLKTATAGWMSAIGLGYSTAQQWDRYWAV